MPGLPEDTASLARKVYHRPQVVTVRFLTSTEMFELALGGAKGEPGKIPRAAFEGARTVTKATRTLWLVALRHYNRHAMVPFRKNPNKTNVTVQTKLRSVNSRGHRCLRQSSRTDFRCGLLPARAVNNSQQRSDRDSRRTFGSVRLCFVAPSSAGNVQMRPGDPVSKLLQ